MAARGVNKVILVGNLGADPEVRYMPNGGVVANVNLATGESWKDQNGQLQERTEWHRVVFFARLGEIVRDYVKKGSKIYVEGRLQTRKWQDKNGQDRYTTEIVANEMQMLDRLGGGSAPPGPSAGGYGPAGRGEPEYSGAPEPARGAPSPGYGGGMDDGFDDDIPF